MTREKRETDNPPFEERLKHALEIHGFPLEIETHQKLLSNDWKSAAETVFVDIDTEKTRRHDFIAWKAQDIDSPFSKVDITLIMECKKRTNSAWVFYGVGDDTKVLEDVTTLLDLTSYAIITMNEKWTEGWRDSAYKKILSSSHQLPSMNHKIAISGHEIHVETIQEWNKRTKEEEKGIRSKKETKGVRDFLHDACVSVIKAIEAHIDSSVEHWDKGVPDILEYVYPVIVFDGQMYWATYTDGNTLLEEIDYVQLKWETKNDYHTIDVVKSKQLDDYLAMIDDELKDVAKGAETLKGRFEIVKDQIRQLLKSSESTDDGDSQNSDK